MFGQIFITVFLNSRFRVRVRERERERDTHNIAQSVKISTHTLITSTNREKRKADEGRRRRRRRRRREKSNELPIHLKMFPTVGCTVLITPLGSPGQLFTHNNHGPTVRTALQLSRSRLIMVLSCTHVFFRAKGNTKIE